MKDISLYSTNELITEISNRCDDFVLCSMQRRSHSHVVISRRFKGNGHTCLGLLQDLSVYIYDQMQCFEEKLFDMDGEDVEL